MPTFKMSQMLPCSSFFSEGRIFLGALALLMQLSLVMWPMAARWASRSVEQSGMEKLLAELSETHRLDPYSMPRKKFRQLA